ncbi:MAG: hypothetical protein IJ996_05465 [Clostridia bacterium]|nr:hypothetical protein [Clostridia bacterium]
MENSTPMKYSQIKHRIKRSQAQAKTLGFFFLIGTLAITVLACLPLAVVEGSSLGVLKFWKPFVTLFSGGKILDVLKANVIAVNIAVLYAFMLLGLLVNVIRSLAKLGWLFKGKASKLYGFNRNMYAMEDLAKLFSRSFNCVLCFHLLIALFAGGITVTIFGYIALAVGVVWHLIFTPIAGNVSLYTTENGITEEKRQVGNFAPIFRNVLQLCALGGVLFFFVKYITATDILGGMIDTMVERGIVKAFVDTPRTLIVPCVSILFTIFVMGTSAYALGIKEYDSEGAKGRGLGNLWLYLFVFLIAVAMYVVGMVIVKGQYTNELIYIALIALGMFVLEILLRKYPRVPEVNADDVDVDEYLTKDEETYAPKDSAPVPMFPHPYWMGQYPQIPDKK